MVFISLFLLSFFSAIISPNNTALNRAERQAEYYISQIDREQNVAENLWALSVLGTSNPATGLYIEKVINESYSKSKLLKTFAELAPDYKAQIKKIALSSGSPDLLIAYLLAENNPKKRASVLDSYRSSYSLLQHSLPYGEIAEAIHQEKSIDGDLLPAARYHFLHTLILLNRKASQFINKDYLTAISENWHLHYSKESLEASLFHATYFRVLFVLNKYSEIEPVYHILIADKLFPQSLTKLHLYRFLDYSMYRLGYYNRNLEIARKFTLPLANYLNQQVLKLRIKLATGINLYSIGKMEEAERIYQEVLNEAKKENISFPFSSLYNNLALTYYKLGKYNKYLDLQFQALRTAQEIKSYSHQLEILNNLFVYYKRSNNKNNALLYLNKARKIAQKQNLDEIGNIYTSIGTVYRQFDSNLKKAQEYFTKAEKVLDPESDLRNFSHLLKEQAKTFEKQRKFSEALKKYTQIITLTQEQRSPSYLDALVNKAIVYLKVGNRFMAERFIKTFKKYDISQLDFEEVVKAKTVEADYLYQTGHSEEALAILKPTLKQVVERAKSSADLMTGFWHVEDEYLNAFELAVSIFIEQDQPKKAVELLDRLKTINDASLYQSPLVKASLLNEKELTQYKRLIAKLDNSRKELLAAPEDQRFEIQQTINQLKLKKKELDRKLTTQVDIPPVSIREVQNNLSARELVLHITELKDKYYIARIFRSKVSIEIIPLDTDLRNLFEKSVQQVANHNTDLNSLYAITKVLGIKEIPNRIEKITIIPDSYLYRLPLAILPLEKPVHNYSYGETRYLIEKFETRYLTSLNEFKTNYDQPSNQNYELNFVGYGVSRFDDYTKKPLVPLPFAKTEVTTIAGKLTNLSNTRTFVNESSTKAAFIRTAPDSRILHLATHSKVSERDPLFSTFYMSRTSTGADSAYYDQIFAYELFELKLNNEMIMLNSCESGSGSYLQGTGIMGISRALQYAGANSLVLNLWPVNDMLASDFAIHFYSLLNKGKSKAAAMRATKLYFLENKNASPHFWGPYMLIGNAEPVVHPNREMNLLVAGTFSFYFLLMIGLSLVKRLRGIKV